MKKIIDFTDSFDALRQGSTGVFYISHFDISTNVIKKWVKQGFVDCFEETFSEGRPTAYTIKLTNLGIQTRKFMREL
jgi:hypothetical protein